MLQRGKLTTVAILQPVLLTMITVITTLVSNVIIPVIFMCTVINIVTNISEHLNLQKIADMLKKGALWIVEISMIIFTCVLSLEGTLTSSVDAMTSKTTKTVVSNVIPVVGKLLGDTVDSVIGGITVTKNAVGFIGIIAILAIVISPLIKTLIMMIVFNLASAIVEPVADKRISKCMSSVGDSIKIVFGVLAIVCFLFVIGVGVMLKITNT